MFALAPRQSGAPAPLRRSSSAAKRYHHDLGEAGLRRGSDFGQNEKRSPAAARAVLVMRVMLLITLLFLLGGLTTATFITLRRMENRQFLLQFGDAVTLVRALLA